MINKIEDLNNHLNELISDKARETRFYYALYEGIEVSKDFVIKAINTYEKIEFNGFVGEITKKSELNKNYLEV